jgi:hypothetical protein
MPAGAEVDGNLLINLIRDQGTLEQLSGILRARGLEHSSGNWTAMIDRLRANLKAKKLTPANLADFLAEVEEHGRQHVFLYEVGRGKSVADLFDEDDLRKRLKQARHFPELGKPEFIKSPEAATVVDVRYEMRKKTPTIVIKTVEPREETYNPQESRARGRLTVTYELRTHRAVNVVRISKTGLVELRIYSHSEAGSYEGLANAQWNRIGPIVSKDIFRPLDLGPLRDTLWDPERRKDIQNIFAPRSSDHKNAVGNRIRATATALGGTMFDDVDLAASVDRFHSENSAAQCERATVLLRQEGSDGILSRSLNTLFYGEPNEFTLTAKVTRNEYEYVLDTLLEHNK